MKPFANDDDRACLGEHYDEVARRQRERSGHSYPGGDHDHDGGADSFRCGDAVIDQHGLVPSPYFSLANK